MTPHPMPHPRRMTTVSALMIAGGLGLSLAGPTDIVANPDADGDSFISCEEGCDLRVSTLGSTNGVFRGPAHHPAIAWTGDRTALAWWQESVHDKGLFLSLRGD